MSAALTLRLGTIDEGLEAGLEDLLVTNWEETEGDPRLPLDIDWPQYRWLERNNMLQPFYLYDGARLVGYSVFFTGPSLHNKSTRWATNDEIWVHPDYRKGRAGVKLIKDCEKGLRAQGIQVILYASKTSGNLASSHPRASVGALLSRLGYEPYEESRIKFL